MKIKGHLLLLAILALLMVIRCEEPTEKEDADDITTGSWTMLGSENISEGEIWEFEIALTSDGIPYVVYKTYPGKEIFVKRFNGSSWEMLGEGNLAETTGDYPDIALAPDGTPYVAFQDEGISEEITVMRYEGGAWEAVMERGFSPSDGSNPDIEIASNGTPVVAFSDYGGGGVLVYGFNGTEWGPIGSYGLDGYGDPQLVINSDDQLYVLRASTWEADLYHFDGTTWNTIGAHNLGYTNGEDIEGMILELDSDDTPHVLFQNDDGFLTMLAWNGSSWADVSDPFYTEAEYGAYPEDVVFDEDNHIYVALDDDAYANFTAYNGSEWSRLGEPNLSEVGHIRLAHNSPGGLYAAIQDYDDLLNVYHFE